MQSHEILIKHLLASGRVNEEHIRQAEDYALTSKISLEEALIFLNLLNYRELGESLSELFGEPYHPVLPNPPSEPAKAKVPLRVAETLGVFPVQFHPDGNRLVLAIENPEDSQLIQQIKARFPAHLRLQFVVASKPEIVKAVDVHYKGRVYAPAKDLEIPEDFTILASEPAASQPTRTDETSKPAEKKTLILEPDLGRANAIKTILMREGYTNVHWVSSPVEIPRHLQEDPPGLFLANARTFPPEGSWLGDLKEKADLPSISFYDLRTLLLGEEVPYHQMSETLIGLVSYLVRADLKGDKDRFQEALTRARLTRRIGLKLNLSPKLVDGAVLAAWLWDQGLGAEVVTQVSTPYRLPDILQSCAEGVEAERVESKILQVVIKFQSLRKDRPSIVEDVHRLRKELSQSSTPGSVVIVEAFLHIMKEDALLRRVDSSTRNILLVDPSLPSESNIALRLYNDGYDVETVKDAREAEQMIAGSGVDLIISEIDLSESNGLTFCRSVKSNAATSHVPFFFLTAKEGERLATECLEAGADDFLKKPIDLDLLSLKVQRVLAAQAPVDAKRGVSGSLQEMSLTDILQSLSTSSKNVEIILETSGRRGTISIQAGEVVHAQFGDIGGEKALFTLMAWEEGMFRIAPCATFPPRTIHASMMSLLMEGARLADEAREGEGPDEDE